MGTKLCSNFRSCRTLFFRLRVPWPYSAKKSRNCRTICEKIDYTCFSLHLKKVKKEGNLLGENYIVTIHRTNFQRRDSCGTVFVKGDNRHILPISSANVSTKTLRSSTKTHLAEPSFRTIIGRRSLRYVAAKTWNNLPDDIKTVGSLGLFRKGLKTCLFKQSYCC